MTRIEYELLREDRPDLRLPAYMLLCPDDRVAVHQSTRERLIVRRAYMLLSREPGVIDRTVYSPPVPSKFPRSLYPKNEPSTKERQTSHERSIDQADEENVQGEPGLGT